MEEKIKRPILPSWSKDLKGGYLLASSDVLRMFGYVGGVEKLIKEGKIPKPDLRERYGQHRRMKPYWFLSSIRRLATKAGGEDVKS